MIRVMHIITGLPIGGSQILLHKLIEHMNRERFDNTVVTMLDSGEIGPKICALGVPVHALHIDGVAAGMRGLRDAVRLIRSIRPHVIQTWLHHADLFGTVAATLSRNRNLAWSLQCASLSADTVPRNNLRLVKLLSWFSKLPRLVISVSEAGRVAHIEAGYRPRRWEVIPNFFNTGAFTPDAPARIRVRAQLGVGEQDAVIGIVGRYHLMKGHQLFLEAAAKLVAKRPGALFLMAGLDIDHGNAQLAHLIESLGLARNTRLLGVWPDMPELMNALDLLTVSSTSEGFPSVLGEAMACAIPCVATDVGDCRIVVGETGRVVPVGDATALAGAWDELLALSRQERRELGRAARERITSLYGTEVIVARYEHLYQELAGTAG